MWPWGHAAVGYLLLSGSDRLVGQRPTAITTLTVLLASQLPDLVDKPLAWYVVVLPNGRSLAHSLVTGSVIVALLASVRAVQEGRAAQGVLAGVALVAGVLTKAPGALLFGIPLGTALLLGANRGGWRAVGAGYLLATPPVGYALWRFLAAPNVERWVPSLA